MAGKRVVIFGNPEAETAENMHTAKTHISTSKTYRATRKGSPASSLPKIHRTQQNESCFVVLGWNDAQKDISRSLALTMSGGVW